MIEEPSQTSSWMSRAWRQRPCSWPPWRSETRCQLNGPEAHQHRAVRIASDRFERVVLAMNGDPFPCRDAGGEPQRRRNSGQQPGAAPAHGGSRSVEENGRAEHGHLDETAATKRDSMSEASTEDSSVGVSLGETGYSTMFLAVFSLELAHEQHERVDALLWKRIVNGCAHSADRSVSFQTVQLCRL